MKDNDKKFTLPMLESPRTLRVKFRKVGNLQYISHLDLQRTFSRVLVRAGLPLWYTKGFNPHIKMVFGMPLPVGVESECELLDIRIEREMSCEEVKARLANELTDELMVLEVYPAEHKFAEIGFAAYDFTVKTTGDAAENADRIKAALSAESLVITKKGKAGLREVDILPLIRELTVTVEGDEIKMAAILSAGENNTLSPEAMMDALRRETGILTGDPTKEYYRILRRRVLAVDGVTEFR